MMERISEMKVSSYVAFFLLICGIVCCSCFGDSVQDALIYYGMSDASAAVAVGDDMFVVADDEDNLLRVYKTIHTSLPVFSYDLTPFLGIEPGYPETDIEGATMIDDTIYWITSHGRNIDGKMRPNRYRFFAVKVKVQNQNITINPVGIPCRTLVHSLLKAENMRHLGFDQATRFDAANLTKQQLKSLAPKENGLNIEALCASADGKTLYIGFRNPRPYSKAIVVPLSNPKQVIENRQPPIFEDPLLWDLTRQGEGLAVALKGYGIRSMEYSYFHKAYFIIAGPHSDEPAAFALYRWSGRKNESPLLVRQINSDFNPEVLVAFKDSDKLLLISDDGSLVIDISDASECMQGRLRKDGKCLNKHLTDPAKKHFRGIWLQP
jgi:hypothetical protein